MTLSIFLARFFGFYFLIMAFLFLFRKSSFSLLLEALKKKEFSLLLGFLSLISGLLIVLMHNVWIIEWKVIITIFGWIALLKGVILFGWPGISQKITAKIITKCYWFYFAVILILGVFMVYIGTVL